MYLLLNVYSIPRNLDIFMLLFFMCFFFCNAAIFKLASKYASVERGFVMRMQLDFFIFVQGIFKSTKDD